MNEMNKKIVISALLKFCTGAIIVTSYSYTDLRFLSSYPKKLIPYFLFSQASLLILTSVSFAPLLSRAKSSGQNNHKINALVFIFLAISLPSIFYLPLKDSYYNTYIFCLWLGVISALSSVTTYTAINDTFDFKKFKQLNARLSSAASLGGMVVGFSIPYVITYLPARFLIYFIFFLLLLAGILSVLLPQINIRHPSNNNKKTNKILYSNQPIIFSVIVSAFLLTFIDSFLDYTLKLSLKSNYSQDEIGKFMGSFYGLANLIIFIMQIWGSRILSRYLKPAQFLMAVPIYCFILSGIAIFLPTLWMLAALRLGENILRYSLDSSGRQLVLSPLPQKLRRNSKLLLKNALFLGTAISSFAILLLNQYNSLFLSIAIIMITSILWIIHSKNINQLYRATLKQCITGRYISTELFLFSNHHLDINSEEIIEITLKSGDNQNILFALNLLLHHEIKKIPTKIHYLLDSKSEEIRYATYHLLIKINSEIARELLMQQIIIESQARNLWLLLEYMVIYYPNQIYSTAKDLLLEVDIQKKCYGLLAIYYCGDCREVAQVIETIHIMVNSPKKINREYAAILLGKLEIGYPLKELKKLLIDPEESVSMAAINSFFLRNLKPLYPSLSQILNGGNRAILASRILIQIGQPVIPILKEILQKKLLLRMQKSIIKTLSQIYHIQAEQALLDIYETSSLYTKKQIAYSLAFRSIRFKPDTITRKFAFHALEEEFCLITSIITVQHNSDSQVAIIELTIQYKNAIKRFLYWLMLITRQEEIMQIIPAILGKKSTLSYATAYEYLVSIAPNRRIFYLLSELEKQKGNAKNHLSSYSIPWLAEFMQHSSLLVGNNMNLTEKILILRKVSIFQELPAEILESISEVCHIKEYFQKEIIFQEGDFPDGMYIIASGKISIEKTGQQVTSLEACDFFGELGLIDDSPRKASAIGKDDGLLLFLNREMFDSITNELPEVLKALAKKIISYLHKLEDKTYSQS